MYELIPITENTYYIKSPTNIGLYKLNDQEVILIDSGSDKSTGRKVRQILDKNNWKLKAIYNTHSHADHIGANRYLQNQTGCQIYAPDIEDNFANHPILEPTYLFGGFPPEDIRHKFLLAQSSEVKRLTQDKLPAGFEIISLPGHSFNMVGLKTPDDIIFLADALARKETLDKYKVAFLQNVEEYLNSLEKVKTLKAQAFVPAHADVTEDITDLAQFNIDNTYEIADKILEICTKPITFEKLLKELYDSFNLELDFEQYVLVGSTVRSYLSWLKEQKKLDSYFKDNELLWSSLQNLI